MNSAYSPATVPVIVILNLPPSSSVTCSAARDGDALTVTHPGPRLDETRALFASLACTYTADSTPEVAVRVVFFICLDFESCSIDRLGATTPVMTATLTVSTETVAPSTEVVISTEYTSPKAGSLYSTITREPPPRTTSRTDPSSSS